MPRPQTNSYLEVQVQTASKEQLLVMLYDGAIRFCQLAQQHLENEDIEASHNNLIRAKAIIVELMCSLDKKIGDPLYSNLISLYNFIYLRLVEANFNKSVSSLVEALEILQHLRSTWEQAIEKSSAEGNNQTYNQAPKASSFNIQG
ncbi:flagellar export chaperone FliS [Planctomycetota bacterium]